MPPPIPVILAPYNPAWPQKAQLYAERLMTLNPPITNVHHIGSTAIPGLAAKPIIDLMPLVSNLSALDAKQSELEALGYICHGELGNPGRRYCTLSSAAGTRLVQLHIFETTSPHATRHLAFRDYLRAHPETAESYESEKRRAQQTHPSDSHAYADAKSAWITTAETIARHWYAAQGQAAEPAASCALQGVPAAEDATGAALGAPRAT